MKRLAFVACVAATGVAAADAQSRPRWEDAFAAFAGGDHAILSRAVVTPDDQRSLREAIIRHEKQWIKEWRPWHALLMLEAAALPTRQTGHQVDGLLLAKAVRLMLDRPKRFEPNAADQRFERLWYRTAAAIVLGTLAPLTLNAMLTQVAPRLAAGPADTTKLFEPRLMLIAAMSAEQLIHPGAFSVEPTDRGGRLIVGGTLATAEAALIKFDEALRHETNAPEAAVRRANVLLRLGRPSDALVALDHAPDAMPDQVLEYWKGLIRGRVLESLGRSDEAVAAYERALAIFPNAQSPHVALAVLHFRQGRRNDAEAWTGRSYALPNDAQDPIWSYWRGDHRFVALWLAELREAAR